MQRHTHAPSDRVRSPLIGLPWVPFTHVWKTLRSSVIHPHALGYGMFPTAPPSQPTCRGFPFITMPSMRFENYVLGERHARQPCDQRADIKARGLKLDHAISFSNKFLASVAL